MIGDWCCVDCGGWLCEVWKMWEVGNALVVGMGESVEGGGWVGWYEVELLLMLLVDDKLVVL